MNPECARVISRHLLLKCILFCVLLPVAGRCYSQIIFVDHTASGANNGKDWANAYEALPLALAQARAGQQIWVARGQYRPSTTGDRSSSFVIPDSVQLYGGFRGTEIQLAERDWSTHLTILSGDLRQDDEGMARRSDNSYSIIYTKNVSPCTLLDGFVIRGGQASDSLSTTLEKEQCGGGWFNESEPERSSSPTARNCNFENNYALSFGGAICNRAFFEGHAAPAYINCTFVNNHASNDGGAVYNQGSFGGSASPRFEHSTFQANSTDASGAAVFNNGVEGKSNPYFINCIFRENTANVDQISVGNGGAMYNHGNRGESSPTIINTIFYKNSGYSGGAVYNLGADEGDSSPNIINSTFCENEAVGSSGSGGAVYNNANDSLGRSNTQISNSIFWDNTAHGELSVLRNVHSAPMISYSIVDLQDCSSLNNGPGGKLLCGEGMQYQTDPMFKDESNGNLHLLPNSPGINAGDDEKIKEMGIAIDLDLTSRIENGQVDLGVYELADRLDSIFVSYQKLYQDTMIIKDTLTHLFTEQATDTVFYRWSVILADSLLTQTKTSQTDTLYRENGHLISTLITQSDSLFISQTFINTDSLSIKRQTIQIDSTVYIDSIFQLEQSIITDSLFIFRNDIPTDSLLWQTDTTYHTQLTIQSDTVIRSETLQVFEAIIQADTLIQLDTQLTQYHSYTDSLFWRSLMQSTHSTVLQSVIYHSSGDELINVDTTQFSGLVITTDTFLISNTRNNIDTLIKSDANTGIDSLFITTQVIHTDSFFLTQFTEIADTLYITQTLLQKDSTVLADSVFIWTETMVSDSLQISVDGVSQGAYLLASDTISELQWINVELDTLETLDTFQLVDTIFRNYSSVSFDTLVKIDTMITVDTVVQEITVATHSPNDKVATIDIKAFPNPASSFLYLQLEGRSSGLFQLSVYNSHGHLVRELTQHVIDARISLQLQDLASGLYLVKLEEDTGRVGIVKFIKL